MTTHAKRSDHENHDERASVAVAFLNWLSPNGPWRLVAIAPDGGKPKGATFAADEDVALRRWLNKHNGKFNIYLHVNDVRPDFEGAKASKSDVVRATHLHVDIDPLEGTDPLSEQRRILQILTTDLPKDVPAPSAIVFSGGGYQAYWKLEVPIELQGDALQAVESCNQWIARRLGGDNCHNIDRIMRVPGTHNVPGKKKIAKGRQAAWARIELCNERTYGLSQFGRSAGGTSGARGDRSNSRSRTLLSDLSRWNVPDRIKTIVEHGCIETEPKQGDNSRSAWLLDAVCGLVRCGVPDEVIFSLITDPEYKISASILERGGGAAESYARRQILRAHQLVAESENDDLKRMNDVHAVVKDYGGHMRVLTERPGEAPFFQSIDDFKNGYLNEFVLCKGKLISIAVWWLKHRLSRKYNRAEFLPGAEPDPETYNLWTGFPVVGRTGDCSKFLGFVLEVICAGNEILANWLFDWMAHAIQFANQPGEVAVALRGGQGIGKSFFVERFGELFGRHFVPLTDPKHIVGNFNAILLGTSLVFADEAFPPNDKRAEGILKGLVTQAHITIEPKGVNPFKVRKYLRLILASNQTWAVPADVDDRRFLVLDVSDAHRRDRAYFAALQMEWSSGGREAFMQFLLDRDVKDFDHRSRPETSALTEQKIYSLRGAKRIIFELLSQGDVPSLKSDGASVFVATKDVLASSDHRASITALGIALAAISRDGKATRETVDGRQQRGFWLLPLTEARRRWSEVTGVVPTWPDDDGLWNGVDVEPDF